MAHFAQLDENNIVTQVIVVADSDAPNEAAGIAFCQNLLGADTNWVETEEDASICFRYASIGMKYDSTNNVFYAQTPYPSWTLNPATLGYQGDTPVAQPDDAGVDDIDNPTKLVTYDWDEDELEWNNKTTHTIKPDM